MNREQQRFQAAVAAMQGYLASYSGLTNAMPGESEVAKNCVGYADALLAELDRTKPEPETPQPDADVWIPHRPGDPCPCEPTDMVFVKLKDGSEWSTPDRAGFWMGDDEYSDSWRAVDSDCAVVAWMPA